MPLPGSRILTLAGSILLIHGIYSAHEHSHLLAPQRRTLTSPPDVPLNRSYTFPPSSGTSTTAGTPAPTIPLDITLQILLASALLILAVVAGSPELRPIRWREWAGGIERGGWDPLSSISGETSMPGEEGSRKKGGKGNPYRALEGEGRKGFWDVRGAKRRFADWVRQGGK